MVMITPQELRLGNSIIRNGIIVTVDNQTFWDIEKHPDQYESIELTEEWMLKFGFKHTGGGFYTHLPSLIQMCSISDKFFHCGFKNLSIGNMYFVHQLQNLYFSLEGEELTIK